MLRSFSVIKRLLSDVASKMESAGLVPELIPVAPQTKLSVRYQKTYIDLGNEVKPTEVRCTPNLEWSANPGTYYTLLLLDPDAPCRNHPVYRNWLHWLVGNIPSDEVNKGQTLAGYIGALPPRDTGCHRYVLLLYKHCSPADFCEPCIPAHCTKGRANFLLKCFVEKYKLGAPIAGNFFMAQWECYVDVMNKTLS